VTFTTAAHPLFLYEHGKEMVMDREKKRFLSNIPGQMLDNTEPLNVNLLVISLAGATLAFLVSLSWAAFLNDSVEAVQKRSGNKYPLPLARLISAIIVTGVVVSLQVVLFKIERKLIRDDDESP